MIPKHEQLERFAALVQEGLIDRVITQIDHEGEGLRHDQNAAAECSLVSKST